MFIGKGVAKYLILNVVYTPPGSGGGGQTGSVTYANGSTAGTTISATDSFKTTSAISVDFKGGPIDIAASYQTSLDQSNTQEVDVKTSSSYSINIPSSKADGIDHGTDQITILLNPTINLALTLTSAKWYPTFVGSHIVILTVAQLRQIQPIEAGTLAELASAGIAPSDYAAILSHDPLAAGAALDSNRYVPFGGYPYNPGSLDSQTQTLTYASTDTSKTEATDSSEVGFSISVTSGFLTIATTTLKDSNTWVWTNSSSHAVSSGTTQSAAFTLVNPSTTWSGNTWVQVYFDRVYNTFAFDLVPPSNLALVAKGSVVGPDNMPAAHREVTITNVGKRYKTWTDSKGQYEFYVANGNTITVGCTSQPYPAERINLS
jgi:hypothetical protein